MQLKNRFIVKMPAFMSLPCISKRDMAVIVIGHLMLLLAWLGFLIKIPTIFAIAVSFLCCLILWISHKPLSKPAFKLLLWRTVLSFCLTLVYGMYGHIAQAQTNEVVTLHKAWYLLSYFLGGLAAYDLYWISKGFKGFSYIETK